MQNNNYQRKLCPEKDLCDLAPIIPPEIQKDAVGLLEQLSNTFGVSAHEDEVCEMIRKSISRFCDIKEDALRNLYLFPLDHSCSHQSDRFTVALDAHMDEVGFIVKSIHKNGIISCLPIGGWDLKNASGSDFEILNADNQLIPAIAITRPVHYGKNTDESNLLFIDAGCTSKEQVEKLNVACGDFVIPQSRFEFMAAPGIVKGKALDDRIGLCAELLLLRWLDQDGLSSHVIALASSQEEVGERGAIAAMSNIQANIAVCFEGCPADDTFESEDEVSTRLNGGPMVRVIDRSSITDHRLIRLIRQVALDYEIPLQIAARAGGGTNAAAFIQKGIPAIVIGIPVRYAHNMSGLASLDDLMNAIRLAYCFVARIIADQPSFLINPF